MATFTIRVTSSATNATGTGFSTPTSQQADLGLVPSYLDVQISGSTDPVNMPNGIYDAWCLNPTLGVTLSTNLSGAVNREANDPTDYQSIVPTEAALMGLLTISLLYAAIRLLRRRADMMGIIFLVTATLLFLGSATLPFGDIPIIGTLVRPWVNQILALGGARGILIGVSLGTLTTGLRVLFGIDRPYGGQ